MATKFEVWIAVKTSQPFAKQIWLLNKEYLSDPRYKETDMAYKCSISVTAA